MRSFFQRLYGNEAQRTRIGNSILNGGLCHAFLIVGPEGSGKRTLATEIAAALSCEHKGDGRYPLPCGECNVCRRIHDDNFVDFKTLKRDGSRATIGVDEVRLFREDMFLSATESEYKVYVIEDADRMTVNAQNALLKVLEEPPAGVIILLLSRETDSILTTIKSRTQLVTMQRFTPSEILEYLKTSGRGGTDRETLSRIMASDGRIGRALEILESPKEVEADRKCANDLIDVLKKGTPYSAILRATSALPQKRAELCEMLEVLLCALSDLIRLKNDRNAPLTFYSDAEEARAVCRDVPAKRLINAFDAVRITIEDAGKNAGVSALITRLGVMLKG